MSDPRSDRLQDILERALAQPESDRPRYIERACGDDQNLRAEIEVLIRSSDRANARDNSDASEQHTPPSHVETMLEAATLNPGDRIGPYKLIQQIGEGGFGIVFMAEQEEPVRRIVALKILKLGMDTKQVIARFEAERQALAMMDHPNIARVLDAGATATGRPFFVMELVRGEAITTYCDRHNLSIEERLDLFKLTCHAVQHAHQKGIIHRDLKPSNVMITLHDGQPVPKVIDFGIAKATSQRLTEKTVFTEFRQFIGTPEYMSPEQAEMTVVDIDTRSDVYSLGVLLYELLTGTTPFDAKQLRKADFPEIRRIIREETPHKPSTRLSTLDTLQSIASDRHIEPRKLSALIKGDLDWIVMKALEKDRTRRYETANGLARDILRYQANEPVSAGPPGTGYRLRKFVSRHRAPVVLGCVVAVALTVSLGIALTGFAQASKGKMIAENEAAKAAAVVAFLNDMLISVDPDQTLGDAVTVRAILDEAATRLNQGELAGRDDVRATLMTSIGKSYSALGHSTDALTQFNTALELLNKTVGPHHPSTVDCLDNLATIYERIGEFDRARALFEQAVDAQAQAPEAHSSIEPTLGLAGIMNSTGLYDDAEKLLRTTIDRTRRRSNVGSDELGHALVLLGQTLEFRGQYDDSIRALREALEIFRELHGSTHSSVAGTLSTLGAALEANGDLERAELAHRESLDIRRRILPEHHHAIGNSLNNLGLVIQRLGRLEEAEKVLRESLANRLKNYRNPHPSTAATLVNLATVLMDQNRLDEAIIEFDRAVDTATQALPDRHMMPAALRGSRARCLIKLERFDEAERELTEAWSILSDVLPKGHRRTQAIVETLVEPYEKTERPYAAAQWWSRLNKE